MKEDYLEDAVKTVYLGGKVMKRLWLFDKPRYIKEDNLKYEKRVIINSKVYT